MRQILFSQSYKWEILGLETCSNLPKDIQLINVTISLSDVVSLSRVRINLVVNIGDPGTPDQYSPVMWRKPFSGVQARTGGGLIRKLSLFSWCPQTTPCHRCPYPQPSRQVQACLVAPWYPAHLQAGAQAENRRKCHHYCSELKDKYIISIATTCEYV